MVVRTLACGPIEYERMVSLASLASQSILRLERLVHMAVAFFTTAAFLSVRYFSSDLSVWSTWLWLFSFGYCFFVVCCFYLLAAFMCVVCFSSDLRVEFNCLPLLCVLYVFSSDY